MIIISNNKEYNQNKFKPEGFTCFNHMIRSFSFLNEYIIDIGDSVDYTKDYMLKKKNTIISNPKQIVYKNTSLIGEEVGKTRISKEMKELKDESLNDEFLKLAKAKGLIGLKGHKVLGGMRASIYNAMPIEGVQILVDFLKEFAASHS